MQESITFQEIKEVFVLLEMFDRVDHSIPEVWISIHNPEGKACINRGCVDVLKWVGNEGTFWQALYGDQFLDGQTFGVLNNEGKILGVDNPLNVDVKKVMCVSSCHAR